MKNDKLLFCRRQREIVTPALFDTAVTGKSDHLFTILENGDDVNPLVSTLQSHWSIYLTMSSIIIILIFVSEISLERCVVI